MVLWKIWFDVRFRFYFCLAICALSVLLLILMFPFMTLLLDYVRPGLSAQEAVQLEKYMTSYRLFMDEGWFNEVRYVSIFGILLALGGVMTERKTRSIFVTLSLPVSRRDWILAQAGMSAILLGVVTFTASMIILCGGWALGQSYPFGKAVWGTLLLILVSMPWIGTALAITSVTQDRLKAGLLTIVLWGLTGVLARFSSIRPWMPESILQKDLNPWFAVVTIFAVSLLTLAVAVRQFEKRSY